MSNIAYQTSHQNIAVNPIWRQWASLPKEERLMIFDDALMHRQRLEGMDWIPVLETFDEYQIRVWKELAL